jgi:hypothetical protein
MNLSIWKNKPNKAKETKMIPKKSYNTDDLLNAISLSLGDGLLNKENNFEGEDVSVLAEIRDSLDGIQTSLEYLSEVIEKGFTYLVKHLPE